MKEKLAIIFPGIGYHSDKPLLYYSRKLAKERGYEEIISLKYSYEELQLKDKYTDYEVPFDRSNYAAAYDYVIKRYLTECYELRNDTTVSYTHL